MKLIVLKGKTLKIYNRYANNLSISTCICHSVEAILVNNFDSVSTRLIINLNMFMKYMTKFYFRNRSAPKFIEILVLSTNGVDAQADLAFVVHIWHGQVFL